MGELATILWAGGAEGKEDGGRGRAGSRAV